MSASKRFPLQQPEGLCTPRRATPPVAFTLVPSHLAGCIE